MDKSARIFVAGHNGLVGKALVRRLKANRYENVIVRSRAELDLTNQAAVNTFLDASKPDYVFIAAAKVGGIAANNAHRADFLIENLLLGANLIRGAHEIGVNRLMLLGSNCVYPKECPQPVKEEYLLTGPLEPTNEPYAIAKIAGIKLCESYNRQYGRCYMSVMPVNLYGPGDNYDLASCHVLPALIRKVHEAKSRNQNSFILWGTGSPRREFMYCDDLADACVLLASIPEMPAAPGSASMCPVINIGTGADQSILEVAKTICSILGYRGEIEHDLSKPDGTHQKLLDTTIMDSVGWKPGIRLEEGVRRTYQAFLEDRSRW